MTMILRLSPSGPNVTSDAGLPLEPGPGFRLRMDDVSATIGDGSEVIPTAKTEIRTTGFSGTNNTLVVELPNPKPNARYGLELDFDVVNTSTNIDSTVQLFLDISVDDGISWLEIASNQHHPSAAADLASDVLSGRQMSLHLPLTLGSVLGVVADAPSIIVRASAAQPSYLGGAGCELYSPYTTGASSHSKGTFYMKIEECF